MKLTRRETLNKLNEILPQKKKNWFMKRRRVQRVSIATNIQHDQDIINYIPSIPRNHQRRKQNFKRLEIVGL